MCICVKVGREEKDSDVRRLLRRATNRAKTFRRQRSRSAHGHLQSVHNERSVDDAVAAQAAAAAAEKHKLSNDELHTASSPDLERRRGLASLLSRLKDEQKKISNKDQIPLSRHANEQQREVVQGQSQRSSTLRNEEVGASLDRARSKNVPRPPAAFQPSKSPSHRTAAGSLSMVPRSYCGIGSRSESVLLFPGHSRDILLKQSRDRLASTGSNSSTGSGLPLLRPIALADDVGGVDGSSSAKSAAAYLGSRSDGGHRRAATRNHRTGGLTIKCWQRPESAEVEAQHSSTVFGQENDLSSLALLGDETVDTQSEKVVESPTVDDVLPSVHSLPVANQLPLPLMEFRKVVHCCTLVFILIFISFHYCIIFLH